MTGYLKIFLKFLDEAILLTNVSQICPSDYQKGFVS